MRFHILTLGCPKNEVDSEGMEVVLTEAGHRPVAELSEADLVIVNTCGFIDAATAESLRTLRELAARKRTGSFLVAAGCLAQREGEALASAVPGLDAILGCRRWPEVTRLAEMVGDGAVRNGTRIPVFADDHLQLGTARRKARGGSAYVKISDGCDASCTFCAIPSIKGPYQSKPRRQVVAEVRQLAEGGAREVVLVGQDTTAYGLDRGEVDGLASLLEEIVSAVPELPWLRVLYLYPQRITPRLLRLLGEAPQLCRYVDIPLQHTHPAVLQRMGRPHGEVGRLVTTIREAVPEVAIRTTFIVGFPGETEEEHRHLLRSIDELRFDHVGVFAFSRQQGTPAATMPNQVRERAREKRWRQAMAAAQRVSLEQNRKMVGRELAVLVEGAETGVRGRAPMMVGRSYRDAPEVDGLVLFSGRATVGEIVRVRITSALEYDLVGELTLPPGHLDLSESGSIPQGGRANGTSPRLGERTGDGSAETEKWQRKRSG